MAEPQTKDNLARIRDNQRRSRARKKEYLQELESKYRACEQMGVQASAEIQAAAKRVLDENRRLRALLQKMGVSDSEIDSFNDPNPNPADTLDAMLRNRRPCNPGSQSACGSSRSGASSKSPASQAPTSTPLSTTSLEPPALPPPAQPSPRSHSSATSISSTFSTPPTAESPMVPIAPLPSFPTNTPPDPSSAYGPSYNAYYAIPNLGNWTWPTLNDMPDTPTQHIPNSSSCLQAADIIRGMRSDVGPELEQEMGCNAEGQDCKVDNNVIFDLVDKYSMQGL
ncbi:hypothetical protein BFW01_g6039 [Lasiodiplodia theobromae]|uniref:BZIP domain-containing protein n=1 Tax=Lasiodiplodia theobromae TaxID=45133 RepID=A0A5N5CXX0_9PEZI|nr:uncharacterized protein LTHEOB_4747 [Lasiodiplodia theobromae]KAB2570208.1 hypothetical protein DBV05_g11133 [Lasiodiplodia theobromae]KAF4546095.1 hypothetical protein LTHEOB_4747 [Lasiodiplodia theobromae]KAF9635144.1 hypothetical protein BFW01_g6039 [Lasiodiplodia theobromae]